MWRKLRKMLAQLVLDRRPWPTVQSVDPAGRERPFKFRARDSSHRAGRRRPGSRAGRAEAWKAELRDRWRSTSAAIGAETDKLGWRLHHPSHRIPAPETELCLRSMPRIVHRLRRSK